MMTSPSFGTVLYINTSSMNKKRSSNFDDTRTFLSKDAQKYASNAIGLMEYKYKEVIINEENMFFYYAVSFLLNYEY